MSNTGSYQLMKNPNYSFYKPHTWSKLRVGITIVVLILVIAVIIGIVVGLSVEHQKFGSMLRVSDHTGIMNRPDIIDSELNWQKKYNSDDRTADEYYDDRIYNHAGYTSTPKHPRDFKHPGTGTMYRKYIEKSAN
jgi:hypothetical protein